MCIELCCEIRCGPSVDVDYESVSVADAGFLKGGAKERQRARSASRNFSHAPSTACN